MPFSLGYKRSKKLLPKTHAPLRAKSSQDDSILSDRKPERLLKKITINLDGVASTMVENGNWFIDHKNKAESKQCLQEAQIYEALIQENEILKKQNEILINLAKDKTDETDKMESELRKLRRIVKKCAPRSNN